MIFNTNNLRKHKLKGDSAIRRSLFYNYLLQNIMDRLSLIGTNVFNILNIGYNTCISSQLLHKLYPNSRIENTYPENIDSLPMHNFDLIVFIYGLHWINRLENFLPQVRTLMTSSGIFIGNCPGAGSFKNTRLKFIQLESALQLTHYNRIIPLIRFHDMSNILKKSGFTDIVSDFELVDLEYKNILSLLNEIKALGESNVCDHVPKYSVSKALFNLLSQQSDIFEDQILLLNFIAGNSRGALKVDVIDRFAQ